MNKIQQAQEFAALKHQDQKYGEFQYTYHTNMVYQIIFDIGVKDEDILIAAHLHDILEDTDTTKDEISTFFGYRVAELVEAVTGRGPTRKERNYNAYTKIRDCGDDAVTLKLADRLANVRCSEPNSSHFSMYLKEWSGFKIAFEGFGNKELWSSLENEINEKYKLSC